jgi:CO/xanthine dehydrogenase Mo-binding subunit
MKAVGASHPRYDGRAHVSGRTVYVDDVRPTGLLHARALRSPAHSARIMRLDTTAAERIPGVRAVVTATDVPRLVVGPLESQGIAGDEPLLALDEVRYRGQPIAVVAADDEAAALAGVEAIELELSERPPFLDVRRAFDPDQPQVTSQGNTFHYERHMERRVRRGDVERAFADADLIVEGVYRLPAIEHAPLETQAAVAIPEPDGRLTVHSTTQAMYYSMGVVAEQLQVPMGRLKFVGGTVGGGFGGKVDQPCEAIACLLALKSGRPVKWRFTREEEMLSSSTRAPWHIEIADAVRADGRILGRRTLTLHDAGAYNRLSPYGVNKHTFHMAGAYTIENVAFNSYVVWTNRVPTSSMRGFGLTSASFAVETHVSRIADVLGMEPWEIRLRNASRPGDLTPTRVVMRDPSAVQVIEAAAHAGRRTAAEA